MAGTLRVFPTDTIAEITPWQCRWGPSRPKVSRGQTRGHFRVGKGWVGVVTGAFFAADSVRRFVEEEFSEVGRRITVGT